MSDFSGLAVICNPEGIVENVIRNDLPLSPTLSPGQSLASIIEAESIHKYLSFFNKLKTEKALYDWEININGDGEIFNLYFVGGVTDQQIVIVASTSKQKADFYYQEVIRMNNEQTDMLRSEAKEKAEKAKEAIPTGGEKTFLEFTKLNNELTNLQRDLHKKNSQLQQLIEVRDQFIGMAAHDLRNPLSGMQSMCSLLLEEEFGALTDEQREFIKSMHESAAHMLEIVNQMLEITKIDAGKLTLNYTSFDLVSLIRKNIEVNKLWASKKEIDIGFTSPYQELVVYGDGGKISQVVDNLLSNAIKYSHRGRPIRVSLSRDNDTVHVAVEDNGQGIPEEELHKIFTPFAKLSVTSTEGEQSTGLGLAICKRIIEGHGGEIHVESTKGEGSTFTFSIPVDGTA